MKKAIILVLTLVLCLSLCACGKNKDVIPAKDALPAVPELVGEWGSIYFAEEPVLVVNEDGSCTVLRQPGTWGLHKDMALWPVVLVMAQLDNKTSLEIEVHMRDDIQHGEGGIFIDNRESNTTLSAITRGVNRSNVVNALDAVPFVVGTWVDGANTEPFAVFNADGTCEILGADGVWGLDYTAYYNEKYRNGWDYCIQAKIGEDEWDVNISEEESGNYGFSIIHPQNGMELVSTWEAKNTNTTNAAG